FYQDIGRHLTQKEAVKEALKLRISQRFALLEEIRLVLETNNDKYKKVLGESLKEEDDPKAFIFPIRFEGKVNKNALVDTGLDISTMPYRVYEKLGREEIKKVGVTTLIAKFLILDIPIDRDASIVVGRGFLYTIGGIVNTPERLFLTFDGICHQTSRAAGSDVLRTAKSDGDDEEEYKIKRNQFGAPILWEKTMMKSDHQEPNALDNMKPWKRYYFHKFIMNSYYGKVAAVRRSLELCREFYSTYEFDEVCDDDELQTKRIIKFRLGGREGFDVYFQGVLRVVHKMITYGLCQRTTGYEKIQKNDLWLLRAGTQRESPICYGQFIMKLARKARVLSDEVLRTLSALIYCIDLNTSTIRELIDSEGRLIPEAPQPGIPRVAIPRP
nr:hypothetical protein [Tanacetum cinerariifolium]